MVSIKCITLRNLMYIGIMLLVVAVVCDSKTTDLTKRNQKRRFCGRMLSETLRALCNSRGGYAEMPKRFAEMPKRSDDEDDDTYIDQPPSEEIDLPYLPFVTRITGTELKPVQFRRFRRGVIEECCRNTCTIQELKGYCNNP